VNAVIEAFKKYYKNIMNGSYTKELTADCSAVTLVKRLKELGQEKVYCTSPTLKLELMGRRVITDLMDIFWEGVRELPKEGMPETKDFPGKIGALLSTNYRRVWQHNVEKLGDSQYHRLQLVTDYICGMTDTFAKRLHAELMNG
jgi:dGTPase